MKKMVAYLSAITICLIANYGYAAKIEGVKMSLKDQTFDISKWDMTKDNGFINIRVKFDNDVAIDNRYLEQSLLSFKLDDFGGCDITLDGFPLKSRRELLSYWRSEDIDKNFKKVWYRDFFMFFKRDHEYTFSYNWNGEEGYFKSYFNGYPLSDTKGDSWSDNTPLKEITFSKGNYTIVELSNTPITAISKEIPLEIGQNHEGKEFKAPKGEVIYQKSLTSADDIADWVMEGPGETKFVNGWMEIHTPQPHVSDGFAGHHTFWCPQELPNNYRIDWDFQTINGLGLGIIFIDALGLNGADIMDKSLTKRTGNFNEYWNGDIRNYHFSYYDSGEWIRANKNPKKCMFAIGYRPRFQIGQIYHLTLVKQNNTIQLAINGRLILEVYDDEKLFGAPYNGGKMALRQMRPAITAIRNLIIQKL